MIRLLAALALLLPATALAQVDTRLVLRPAGTPFDKRTIDVPSPGAPSFKADVYSPRGTPKGAIVFVSGTNDARDWGVFIDMAKLATERGLIGIIPAKRWPRGGGASAFETANADTIAMFNALEPGGAIGIGARKSCVWLFSGGGPQLAAVYAPDAPAMGCMIGFYPFFGGPNPSPSPAWDARYMPLDVYRANSARKMPMLVVRAGKDSEGLNRRLADFAAAALAANADLTLINLPDAVHAFDIYDDTDWSRATIRTAFDFAVAHIAP